MSQAGFIAFIVVCFVLVAGGLSAIFIDYVGLIARLFRDKPHCGYMDVFNGKGYEYTKGWRVVTGPSGDIWNYIYEGRKYEVRTGDNYPVRYKERGRYIKCRPGVLVALPLGPDIQPTNEIGAPYEPQFTEAEVGLDTYGYALVELNKSIRGKGGGGILVFILIGVIVLMAIGGVWYWQSHKNDKPPATGQQTQQTVTPGVPNNPLYSPTPTNKPEPANPNITPLPSTELFNRLLEVKLG